MSSRREFILQTSSFCAAAAGLGFLATLDGCKTPSGLALSSYDAATNKISLPLSSFNGHDKLVIDGPGSEYRIFLMKKSDLEITALQLKCTHRGHGVDMEETRLHCPLHGSEFDFDGNVTNGPAASPLKKFPATVEGGNVVIVLV